jgi:hypothetical protein
MCCNYRQESKLNHKAIEKFFKFTSQSFNEFEFVASVNDDKTLGHYRERGKKSTAGKVARNIDNKVEGENQTKVYEELRER